MRRFSNRILWVLLLAVLWPPTAASAQLAPLSERFVADLDPDFRGAGSQPLVIAQLPGALLFAADDGLHGVEPWRSDGSVQGTSLLADTCDGTCAGHPQPHGVFGGLAFFSAAGALWRTDGTVRGTSKLQEDLVPASAMVAGKTHFYFLGRRSGDHKGLWQTDGTAAGTRLIHELPATPYYESHQLQIWRERLFFWTQDAPTVFSFWRSDGSGPGTVRLRSFSGVTSFQDHATLGAGRDGLVLRVATAARGLELWTVPGPADRPAPIPQLEPGPRWPSWHCHGIAGDRVLVAATVVGGVPQIYWTTGGKAALSPLTRFTPEGAVQLSTLGCSLPSVGPRRAVFEVTRGIARELWVTDGTPSRTKFLAEVGLGNLGATLQSIRLGGWLHFAGWTPAAGLEPWRTDGRTTQLLRDTCKGVCDGDPRFIAQGTELWLQTRSPKYRPVFWRTAAAASRIERALRLDDPFASLLGVASGHAMLVHDTLHTGPEPWVWRADGTLSALGDLHPGSQPTSSNPRDFQAFGNRAVFVADSATLGKGFWVSDGTAPGSRRLENRGQATFERLAAAATTDAGLFLLAGQYSSGPRHPVRTFVGGALWLWDGTSPFVQRLTPQGVSVALGLVAVGNQLFFCANGTLWTSDGSVAGTRDLSDTSVDRCTGMVGSTGGQAYFLTPTALWRTDGTSAGTIRVLVLPPGVAPQGKTGVLGSQVFFLARRTTDQSNCPDLELWRWDELAGAQAIVLEALDCLLWLGASLSPLGPSHLLAAAHSISWTALALESRLWLTDGTAAGTYFVARTGTPATSPPVAGAVTSPLPSPSTAESQPVVELAGRHYFMGPGDFTTGRLALWSSDGSVAGTRSHADLVPSGYRPADPVAILTALPPNSPWVAGGRVIMEVEDATSKRFLLETAGSPETTNLHGQIEAQGAGAVAGRFFFSRNDGHGNELWILEEQP